MRNILVPLTLSAALLTAACQNPDGSTAWGPTLALGAGVGMAGAAVAGAAIDDRDDRRWRGPPVYYGPGYGHGWSRHDDDDDDDD